MIERLNSRAALPPFEVAIVGLGRAGWNQHFLPLSKNDAFRITAAVDPVSERREEAASLVPGCEVYPSLEALLDHQQPALVVVATPSVAHFADASRVLAAGCHCILEKPMTTSASEAFALVDLAEELERHLFIHQQHAFGHEAALLKSLFHSGELGRWFHLRTLWGGFNRRRDWQTLQKNGGGQLNNTFPHIMSVIGQFLPGPFEVDYACLRNIKDAGDAEDHLHVILKTTEGVMLDITATTTAAITEPRWQIYGSKGSLTLGPTGGALRYDDAEEPPAGEVIDGPAPGRLYNLDRIEWRNRQLTPAEQPIESFYTHVQRVLQEQAAMRVSARACAEIIALMEEIRKWANRPPADRATPVRTAALQTAGGCG